VGSQRKIEYKNNGQLRIMAQAGVLLSEALDAAVVAVAPGVTTDEIDAAFAEVVDAAGAQYNFLGYYGYPKHICVSVNDEVVHGIPGPRKLAEGDILSIDGGCVVRGWNADSARTVIVGEGDPEDVRLSEVTRRAMWAGIAAFARASYVGDIGDAIDDFVSAQEGAPLGILEDYVGHGIGSAMHMAPDVLNYRTGHRGPKVKPGMALAIEPMLVRGSIDTKVLGDEWTVVTTDGSRASQWEHSVARHSGGLWVLTAPDGGASELEPLGVTPVPIPA
jgi:methionyl aminopeptidase